MPENPFELEKQFLEDSLSYESYQGEAIPYSGSQAQLAAYERISKEDQLYKQFIISRYGSVENYQNMDKLFRKGSVYDPTVDYMLDVTVITGEAYYKTDHISANEVIMESMSGICSFNFTRKDGSAEKVNGTLDAKYLPGKEIRTRSYFFSPLANDRIVVWNINKQKWSSFFMNNLFKFVRDDTTDIE